MKNAVLIIGLCMLIGSQAGAATITWDTPQDISGESDVPESTEYVSVFGAYGNAGGNPDLDINGVVFGNNATTNKINITGTIYSSFAGTYEAETQEYDDLLLVGAAGGSVITLGTGNTLTIGQSYMVQVWAHDDRALAAGRLATLTSVANVVQLTMNDTGVAGGKGQWVTGTFTADATAQYINISGGGAHAAGQVINAVALYTMTNSPVEISHIEKAYWQMDDWSTRPVFVDAYGTNHLILQTVAPTNGFVGANPIPNPDTNLFVEDNPWNNTRSLKVARGSTDEPVTGFNMTTHESWTFEGWYNWDSLPSFGVLAATRGQESGGDGWEMYSLGSGRLDCRMVSSGVVEYACNSGATLVSMDAWYHVALVWDHDQGSDGEMRLYLDGSEVGSVAATSIDDSAPKAFYIGGRDWTANGIYSVDDSPFNGYQDELRFSSGALEANQFLNASGGDYYAAWIAQYPAVDSATNQTDNSDGDSLDNLLEWAFGGDPSDSNDVGHVSTHGLVDVGGTDYLEYVYAKRDTAAALGLVYHLKRHTDLMLPAVDTNNHVVGSSAVSSQFVTVTNQISTAVEDEQFLNLSIESN